MRHTFHMQLDRLKETLFEIEQVINSLDEKTKYKIMFICEELLTNIVRHGDFQNRTPDIEIMIEINNKESCKLECRDNAKAFNLLEHQDPNTKAVIEEREIGGLGIYLLKKYAKEINYSYENGFNGVRVSI